MIYFLSCCSVQHFYLVALFLEFNVSQYDYFTIAVSVIGGSLLGAVILWDLIEEIKSE